MSPNLKIAELRTHCWRSSSRVIRPVGTPQSEAARRVSSSHSASGCDSMSSRVQRAHSLAISFSDRRKLIFHREIVGYLHEGRKTIGFFPSFHEGNERRFGTELVALRRPCNTYLRVSYGSMKQRERGRGQSHEAAMTKVQMPLVQQDGDNRTITAFLGNIKSRSPNSLQMILVIAFSVRICGATAL